MRKLLAAPLAAVLVLGVSAPGAAAAQPGHHGRPVTGTTPDTRRGRG